MGFSCQDWSNGARPAKGWDVADCLADGWGANDVTAMLKAAVCDVLPSFPHEPAAPEPEPDPLPVPAHPVGADAISLIPREADLENGSEVEMATKLAVNINMACGASVYADGAFWAWGPTAWQKIKERSLRLAVHKFDRVTVQGKSPIKIGKRTIDGILSETGTIMSDPGFFNSPCVALNAMDVVIEIAKGGQITTRPHDPDDRFRFTIPAVYGAGRNDLPKTSMLYRLVHGAFDGDDDAAEKIDLVGEILGAAAFGIATKLKQPKAFVFLGETASNGKSTIAGLLECLLPDDAVSHIPLSAFEDERRIVNLAGKAANVVDELSASGIAGEAFKAAVTGNAIEGRDLYRSAMTFMPKAIIVATTNTLPRFNGGLDRGLQRRMVVLRFNRPIPDSEIVEDIAERIKHDELDLLLGFAIAGAQRLFKNLAYTIPHSATLALSDWLKLDPVNEWFDENIDECDGEPLGGWMRTTDLFKEFKTWAVDQGHNERYLPAVNVFSQRLGLLPGVVLKRRAKGTYATGICKAGEGRLKKEDAIW